MKTFKDIFDQHHWNSVKESIYSKTSTDVELALTNKVRTLKDFKALISPAAKPYLGNMAELSHQLTLQRFGKTIQLYVPMYLSNECQNICTYCGFSMDVKLRRITLNETQINKEMQAIKKMGFDHILVVTGEANKTVGLEYFLKSLELIRPHFSNITFEVQPLEQSDYEKLMHAGVHGVLVYQETYHKEEYKTHHPKGKKSNFYYRLDTPDRLGRAGMHKIGLGSLIGLEDWRTDSFFTALHLDYLEKTYWKTKYSISFPRLRPNAGGVELKSLMSDSELIQLICAYRIFNQNVELSLSTRESEKFRNHALKLGVTTMSAGSKTDPGGYAHQEDNNLEQFEISDDRSPKEIQNVLKESGYEAVWKDWDSVLS